MRHRRSRTRAHLRSSKALFASFILLAFTGGCAAPEDDSPGLLGNGIGIDHVVLVVSDLEAARDYYVDVLGFRMETVAAGGRHPTGTRNVGAYFPDISYLELLAIDDRDLVAVHRPHYIRFTEQFGSGVRFYALSTSSAADTHSVLTQRGLGVNPPAPGTLQREGRTEQSDEPRWWIVSFTADEPPADRPFFIEYTNRPYDLITDEWDEGYAEIREEDFYAHTNTALGVKAVLVAVPDLAASREAHRQMGLELLAPSSPNEADRLARFKVRRHEVILVSAAHDPLAAAFVSERGAGVMEIQIEVADLPAARAVLDAGLPPGTIEETGPEMLTVPAGHAYGVRLSFVQETPDRRPGAPAAQ
jgi:catechol 2,3-dioxygenase-like lactoylglutathione lyase family enzyme